MLALLTISIYRNTLKCIVLFIEYFNVKSSWFGKHQCTVWYSIQHVQDPPWIESLDNVFKIYSNVILILTFILLVSVFSFYFVLAEWWSRNCHYSRELNVYVEINISLRPNKPEASSQGWKPQNCQLCIHSLLPLEKLILQDRAVSQMKCALTSSASVTCFMAFYSFFYCHHNSRLP